MLQRTETVEAVQITLCKRQQAGHPFFLTRSSCDISLFCACPGFFRCGCIWYEDTNDELSINLLLFVQRVKDLSHLFFMVRYFDRDSIIVNQLVSVRAY